MNKAEAKDFIKQLAQYPNQRAAAKAMGIAQSNVSGRLTKARQVLGSGEVDRIMEKHGHSASVPASRASAPKGESVAPASPGRARAEPTDIAADIVGGDPEKLEKLTLEEENRRLRLAMKRLNEAALTDERVRREIFEIAHSKPAIPEWLSVPMSTGAESAPGVPILFGSDWHWGEVVRPEEIGGVNKYNLEIARARMHRLIEQTINLLTNHMVNPQYPGIVFALGGDMVSGNIHEELSETNDMPIMPVVLDLIDHLIVGIKRLKEVFGRVFLPCVAGNHGRLHKKVRAKESNFNSYDWLIYQSLDRHFADDPDVVFYIPDGSDALVEVAGHRYLFTHGNQYRGGDGMIGAIGPIIRGDHKKRSRNGQIGQEFDTQVMGHFHQLLQMKRVIVNGSLIGYNEYASNGNFGYEPPQQALWITHPVQGITFSMPVHVGENHTRDQSDKAWVSWHDPKQHAA